jgi:hypothetical protein
MERCNGNGGRIVINVELVRIEEREGEWWRTELLAK